MKRGANANDSEFRHPGEGRDPAPCRKNWIQAFAGMTVNRSVT